jgi:hypothetical protein
MMRERSVRRLFAGLACGLLLWVGACVEHDHLFAADGQEGAGTSDAGLSARDGPGDGGDAGDGGVDAAACAGQADCADEQRCFEGFCLDEPPQCGGLPPQDCRRDLRQEACILAGGSYECPSPNPGGCWCECLATDRSCPCWRASHCQGHCLGSLDACHPLQIGSCSRTLEDLPVGCFCLAAVFTDEPFFELVCIN